MPDKPKPHAAPNPPEDPSVYGGRWGPGDEQNPQDKGKPDRPGKIKPPNDDPPGAGEQGGG
jgi:hypothetical protein